MALVTLTDPMPADDFIPKDAGKAVMIGCSVAGIGDPPEPYAEAQVYIKWDISHPGWDYKPVMSRRQVAGDAINACIKWLQGMKATIEAQQSSKR